jgi:hypothetical protein
MTTNRKAVACGERMSYKTLNTRAVTLVRKEDVHYGRVFYCLHIFRTGQTVPRSILERKLAFTLAATVDLGYTEQHDR